MAHIDIINALFESLGGLFAIINIAQLIKDKEVKGVNIFSAMFFMVWGLWAVFFYYNTNNLYSMYASMIIALAEVAWVALWVYYAVIFKTK